RRGESLPGLPAHLYDLFPDRLVDSELGEIPDGWEVCRLGDMIENVKGCSYKSEELVESDTALVTLKSFGRGGGYRPEGLKPFIGRYAPKQVVRPGEVVIACTDVTQAAEVIGRPAMVRRSPRYPRLVASLDTVIIRPQADRRMPNTFIYFLCLNEQFRDHAYSYVTGTTVLHLAKEGIPSFRFALPSLELMQVFEHFAGTIATKIEQIALEGEILTALRDTLLRKLVSGELRIMDSGRILERAVP
ncbi:MAG: hypothetical protein K6T37_04690, partial [Acidothermus cellulolyticus]|nr:hypothetical protein [Acidothermus cellulolyticus]